MIDVQMTLNGQEVRVSVAPHETLVETLRDRLGLSGTRVGCEQGVCGACTVLLDGAPVRSCLVLTAQTDGVVVESVEALSGTDDGRAVTAEFVARRAYQCGFCTAGFEMLGLWLMRTEQDATIERAREVAGSNLCRCTGYAPIVEALHAVTGRGAGEQ